MLEAGFEAYERVDLSSFTDPLPQIGVVNGEQSRVRTVLAEKVLVTIPKSGVKIECKTEAIAPLPAPISRGQEAGEIIFTCEGKEIARVPLVTAYAAAKKKEKGFWEKLFG
jgi:D-alanyl-D-alanine carboxypeptidase